jgi:FkbM family methyltransferase
VREMRELARIRGLPPHRAATTGLLGFPIEFTHGESFAAHYRPIFQLQQYALPAALSGPGIEPVIIDCGANIGLATIFWTRATPNAHITAIEPDPMLASVLRRNLDRAAVRHVNVVEAAAWTEAGLELSFWHQGAGGGRLTELAALGVDTKDLVTTPTIRLLDSLDQHVDVLKIDIEGAELEVIQDCAPALGNVDYLFVEYHSFPDRPQRLPELLATIRDAGFRLYVESEHQLPHPWTRDADSGMDLQLNVFAARS